MGETLNKTAPTNKVTNSSPTTVGKTVTFTATVAGAGVTPTGSVIWKVSGTAGATSCNSSTTTLSSGGTATCTITISHSGTYAVYDIYGGDANYTHAHERHGHHLMKRLRRALSPRRWVRKPLIFGAVVALVVGVGAGSAFAYFTSLGSGSGTASVGTTPLSVTVEQATGTVTNLLYPGDASGDLRVTLDNPNSYPVTIVGITGNGSASVSSAGIGTCNTTGVTVNTQSGLSIPVASDSNPPNNPVSVVIPNGVSMNASSDSGCQGATFSVPVTVTVQKG